MWGAIVVGAITLGKALYDEYKAGKQLSKDEMNFMRAVQNMDVENPEKWYAQYQQYIDPIMKDTYQIDGTEYDNINVDPDTLYAQNKALDELINLSEAQGLGAIDQQALDQVVNEENRNLQGQNDAILQNAMERGVYGSGLELAQRLQNAQSGANRMNDRGLDIMSQAQQRALESLASYGDLASQMRTQSFDEQSRRAEAMDQINKWNAENSQAVQNANVDAQNETNRANVGVANAQEDQRVQTERDLQAQQNEKANTLASYYGSKRQADAEDKKSKNQLTGTIASVGASYFGGSN